MIICSFLICFNVMDMRVVPFIIILMEILKFGYFWRQPEAKI
jgi:hypothetical protein